MNELFSKQIYENEAVSTSKILEEMLDEQQKSYQCYRAVRNKNSGMEQRRSQFPLFLGELTEIEK